MSGQAVGANTTATVINQYLDEEGDDITIADLFTLAASAPGGYDTETWEEGVWT